MQANLLKFGLSCKLTGISQILLSKPSWTSSHHLQNANLRGLYTSKSSGQMTSSQMFTSEATINFMTKNMRN